MGEGRPVDKETLRISERVRDHKDDVKMCAHQQPEDNHHSIRPGTTRCPSCVVAPQASLNLSRFKRRLFGH